MDELTECQLGILHIVEELIAEKGYPPTYVDIAKVAGIYPNAVYDHIRGLERKGYIAVDPGKSRSMRVLHSAEGHL